MTQKTILGLDLGTNSIGWALIEQDSEANTGKILGMGSRIIPMGQDIKDEFGKGNSISKTADRTKFRSVRRLRERNLERRNRLHRILNILGFLPEHYKKEIDFEKNFGQFYDESEPKIAWRINNHKKYEFIFRSSFDEMAKEFNGVKIPYDWTLYYLRKKAISSMITKEELAWVILNFNQKRGYYQLRGEDFTDNNSTREYVIKLMIVKIEKGDLDKKNDRRRWYKIFLSNGWEYSATFTAEPLWENTEKEFLVTEEYDEEGNVKVIKDKHSDVTGKEKRRITPLPTFDEINLMTKKDQDKIYSKIKARTEMTINQSGSTVGAYIFDSLLQNPSQKIIGKLIRTIERKFYKEELRMILQKQIELQPQLFTDELYNSCVRELYRSNESHKQSLSNRDFIHLFVEDIIFYQRPLRSQKSSIGNCNLEFKLHKINVKCEKGISINNEFEKDKNGKDILVKDYLKAIPKSNPYYQEFRLWQWLRNLSIITKNDDTDVTSIYLKNHEDYESLFNFLLTQKEVNHKIVFEHLFTPIIKDLYPTAKPKLLNDEIKKLVGSHRWNYVFDDLKDKEDEKSKKYPCNETGFEISKRLKLVNNVPDGFLTREIEQELWHLIYSVTDKIEYEKALNSFSKKHCLDDLSFVENFKKFPPFKSEYGAYSEKAIKKLLPLMRQGNYWSWDKIDKKVQERIEKLQTGEFDQNIENRVREKVINLIEPFQYQGLPEWLAKYIVYGRHSEAADTNYWKVVADLELYLKEFKQHSLRNPIVEQVITETLRVVRDIWQNYGNGKESFFTEIHVELGREMKNTAEDRKRMTTQVSENENTNHRIKALLVELSQDVGFKNVIPHSPKQQEILKIYEEYALNNEEKFDKKDINGKDLFIKDSIPEDIIKISKLSQPTKSELIRYKLWLEQKYRSPYTGQMIPLSRLFTSDYEIEHVIPQSRYFDDSYSNKIICESAVNKLKDKLLGLEFIKKYHGEIVQIGNGTGKVQILNEEAYIAYVNEHYNKLRSKRNKLLLEEIPEAMILRQLNDTRYISKFITSILSNLVRSNVNDNGINSKNIVFGNGKITSTLKQDWGLNNVWNELVINRFERLNALMKTEVFTTKNKEGHLIPAIPFEYSKGFQKKRIDHRHHAMDALIIACATRDHVNLLNNESAKSEKSRFDLQVKLRHKESWIDSSGGKREKFTQFKKPWINFVSDAKFNLEKVVVSFKQNLRVINKTKFKGYTYKESKELSKGRNWAIRQSLHEETVSGYVNLPWVKCDKGEFITATRKSLNTSFNLDKIEKITDLGIQEILRKYLKQDKFKRISLSGELSYDSELAFSPEGIDELNKNIKVFNNGKFHQPILKVRVYEKGSGRFKLGENGQKKYKFVQGAPNLFYAVYECNEIKGRLFETVPLNEIIEHQKVQENENISKDDRTDVFVKKVLLNRGKNYEVKFLFSLSPNDLVYMPLNKENLSTIDFSNLNAEQLRRVFVVNDFSGTTCYFRPYSFAKAIVPKEVDMSFDESKNKIKGSFDSKTASYNRIQIKEFCIKLKMDRLGNISRATF
ncbi:MAG: HNH endonuclease domain-containing protein [Bacteroidota bacterium]|nr:HNH endonuclease domain-containing protein [Bacteroidota bacterium]